MNTLDTAIALHSAGIAPLPVKADGSKAPGLKTWKQYQRRQPSIDEVLGWFGSCPDGIGLLTGGVSGGEARHVNHVAVDDTAAHARPRAGGDLESLNGVLHKAEELKIILVNMPDIDSTFQTAIGKLTFARIWIRNIFNPVYNLFSNAFCH